MWAQQQPLEACDKPQRVIITLMEGERGGAAAGTESGLEQGQGEGRDGLQKGRWLGEVWMRRGVGALAAA